MEDGKKLGKVLRFIVVLAIALVVNAMPLSIFADTIFVGASGAGVLQLGEDLQVSAISDAEDGAAHFALSGTERLYCAYNNKLEVYNPKTLGSLKTIDAGGKILAMELCNGVLYVLVYARYSKILLISDYSQEIINQIAVGGYASDFALTKDGLKIYVAKPSESRIDVFALRSYDSGYGVQYGYGIYIPKSEKMYERIASICCGGRPNSLTFNLSGNRLYISDGASSCLFVVNAETNRLISKIAVGSACARVRANQGHIYALPSSPTIEGFYLIEETLDLQTSTVQSDALPTTYSFFQLQDHPHDIFFHPNSKYAVVVSCTGDKVIKLEDLRVVTERSLPNPQAALITDADIAEPGVIYAAGSVLHGPGDGSEDYNGNAVLPFGEETSVQSKSSPITLGAPAGIITHVIQPAGGEKWNGVRQVFWFTDAPAGYYAYVSCLVGQSGMEKEYSLHRAGLRDAIWFEWDTSSFDIDSPYCKIRVRIQSGTTVSDGISPTYFLLDNTPPLVTITYPPEQDISHTLPYITVAAQASDELSDLISPLEIEVNGSIVGYAELCTISKDPFAGQYVGYDIPIADYGRLNIVKVIARDELGNKGYDEVNALVGWMMHVDFPQESYEISAGSTGAATCQMILDLMRQGTAKPLLSQNDIYYYGHRYNRDQDVNELDPDGMDAALGYFDPWEPTATEPDGNPLVAYNFEIDTFPPEKYNEYLKNIVHWIAYTVPLDADYPTDGLVEEPNVPAAVPVYGESGDYHWVAINGAATSADPYVIDPVWGARYSNLRDFVLYGMWITDPDESGIGSDVYVSAAELGTYFQPINREGDAFDGLYVSITEPPTETLNKMTIAPPNVNSSTLALVEIAEYFNNTEGLPKKHLIDTALTVDLDKARPLAYYSLDGDLAALFARRSSRAFYEKAPYICWKEVIPPALLADKRFRDAINGATARAFLYVRRMDTEEEYILIPFDKFIEGRFMTSVAIIVDRKEGYFKQAKLLKEPIIYRQPKREEIIGRLQQQYPNLDVDARLVWRPGRVSKSPFYPYWEVRIGEKRLSIVKQR